MTGPIIVDVCGTFVLDDTTVGLLAWHYRKNSRWRYLVLRACTGRRSLLRVGFGLFERIAGRHVLKYILVRGLKGVRVSALEESAGEYAGWLMAHRRVHAVSGILDQLGGQIVLASASLQPIVEALGGLVGARCISSTLEISEGRYTGRYSRDLTGCKLQALEQTLNSFDVRKCIVISDNLSDRPLLESAGVAYVVLLKPSHARRWAGVKAEYINVC